MQHPLGLLHVAWGTRGQNCWEHGTRAICGAMSDRRLCFWSRSPYLLPVSMNRSRQGRKAGRIFSAFVHLWLSLLFPHLESKFTLLNPLYWATHHRPYFLKQTLTNTKDHLNMPPIFQHIHIKGFQVVSALLILETTSLNTKGYWET